MRRTAENANAARKASGKGASAGRDPSHRIRASKPAQAQSPRSAVSGRGGLGIDAAEWAPEHELAPGLHIVATPIGNLGDVTLRALWVLRGVDRILCEDTRVTAKLLARYGIDTPLDPYHDHNADRVRPAILESLRRGERLALVSDAGTPLVSDPGYKLVRATIAEDLPVTAAPGPSAALTALTLSGLPPDVFLFAGFLPPRSAARRRALTEWRGVAATLIFFEGPSRLAATLADMAEILGDRAAAIARELTKRHEEMRRDRLSALADHYRGAGPPRGEVVIVVGPPEPEKTADADIDERLRTLLAHASLRDAVAQLAAETGLGRRALYERALALQSEDEEP
ncbi:MAG TPA: 16S rRNA (cytidine(1402)-2'-O)-methyltransferase [Stellaceae bacterium]|nr:16S rRNA (cytidine(1402)-2'-O)-methyltransferase [Stellaceae bacterium]